MQSQNTKIFRGLRCFLPLEWELGSYFFALSEPFYPRLARKICAQNLAMFVRSMTIFLVENGTLGEFIYYSSHYAIVALFLACSCVDFDYVTSRFCALCD